MTFYVLTVKLRAFIVWVKLISHIYQFLKKRKYVILREQQAAHSSTVF